MQGRLSPAGARPQSFPWESWQAEFPRARSYGFDLLEWLFDAVAYERNPIWSEGGLTDIRGSVAVSGVSIDTVCADYFVTHPLLRTPDAERPRHIQVLNMLITRAALLGARVIVVPALEAGDIQNADDLANVVSCLSGPLALAGSAGVTLALESNMPANRYLQLVAAAPTLRICFDTGNRTAAGRDIVADIRSLASYVAVVHIKDRLPAGPNVPLGTGAAPLDTFLVALGAGGYSGPLILETTVGEDYAAQARLNLEFVRSRVRPGPRPAGTDL